MTDQLRVVMGSIERRGPWTVPKELAIRVLFGNAELDLRDAVLEPGTTTFTVHVSMGNLELIVWRPAASVAALPLPIHEAA